MKDKANSDDQLESTNNRNIIDQGRGGFAQDNSNAVEQVVNQQTENAECENSSRESQFLKDASVIRRRHTTPIHVPSKFSKPVNISSGSSTSSNSAGEGSSGTKNANSANGNGASEYECNICFDTASSPVLTLCGHLFCWPCLHQWLETQAQNPLCPVCKAGCGHDKVIPIYGRGKEAKDPRMNADIPNRPAGQRPQPQRDPNQPAHLFPVSSFHSHSTAFGPHFSISTSTIFPSLFSAQFTLPPPNGPPSPLQAFMSRLLLMFGCLILIMFLLY